MRQRVTDLQKHIVNDVLENNEKVKARKARSISTVTINEGFMDLPHDEGVINTSFVEIPKYEGKNERKRSSRRTEKSSNTNKMGTGGPL
mgnify:CR=1 FL=1